LNNFLRLFFFCLVLVSIFEQFFKIVWREIIDEGVRGHVDELLEGDPFVAVLVADRDHAVDQILKLFVVELENRQTLQSFILTRLQCRKITTGLSSCLCLNWNKI
jgi:hypothetical protein